MDRDRVGRSQGIELTEGIFHLTAVEARDQHSLCLVDPQNRSEIAIEDVTLVIVLDLHHLVAGREDRAEFLDASRGIRIQDLL